MIQSVVIRYSLSALLLFVDTCSESNKQGHKDSASRLAASLPNPRGEEKWPGFHYFYMYLIMVEFHQHRGPSILCLYTRDVKMDIQRYVVSMLFNYRALRILLYW